MVKAALAAIALGAMVLIAYMSGANAATLLPAGETCFQATTGINGMIGTIGSLIGGSGGTSGTYTNVSLTGGSGSGASANITVSGGAVTAVQIFNPGTQYVVADVLGANAPDIGNVSGFSIAVYSVSLNSSLAGGSVGFFIPNTLTPSQTWQNPARTILNGNPVQLDQNGCAIIYGEGVYRQILKDSLGNSVWDQLTASTDLTNFSWAGTAAGTSNAITLTDAAFTYTDGQVIGFIASATNTASVTIAVNGGAAANVVKATSSGPVGLTGSEIVSAAQSQITYNASAGNFQLTAYPLSSATVIPPNYSCDSPLNAGLKASTGASALTISLVGANGAAASTANPVLACFRSTASATGTPVWATITSPLAIVIPSGATLGTANAVPARIWVLLEYNSGAPMLVVATCSSATQIYPCKTWKATPTTTTSISSGSTSAGVPYSSAGNAADALSFLGYVEATEATAGTWITAPSTVQVSGYGVPLPGDVVQTITNSTTTSGTTTSATFAALTSGQSQAIVPTSNINLIRLLMQGTTGLSAPSLGFVQLARGSTLIGNPAGFSVNTAAFTGFAPSMNFVYDAPATAGSTTYSVYGKVSTGTLSYPAASSGSILELQEIMGSLSPANDNQAMRMVG